MFKKKNNLKTYYYAEIKEPRCIYDSNTNTKMVKYDVGIGNRYNNGYAIIFIIYYKHGGDTIVTKSAEFSILFRR